MSVKLLQQAVLGCDGCGLVLAGKPDVLVHGAPVEALTIGRTPPPAPPEAYWFRLSSERLVSSPFRRPRGWDLCPDCYRKATQAIDSAFLDRRPVQ